jgi:hypothetical protein
MYPFAHAVAKILIGEVVHGDDIDGVLRSAPLVVRRMEDKRLLGTDADGKISFYGAILGGDSLQYTAFGNVQVLMVFVEARMFIFNELNGEIALQQS